MMSYATPKISNVLVRTVKPGRHGARGQRWYFRKLLANGSIFLGIYTSRGIDSAVELISRRKKSIPHR
jgi:hypothetical protein